MQTHSRSSARPTAPLPWASTNVSASSRSSLGRPSDAGVAVSIKRGDALFSQGDPADSLYKVVNGSLRLCRILSDGERQICDFLLAGDLAGLGNGDDYEYSAEALEDCRLIRYRRSNIAAMIRQDADFGVRLQALTATGLHTAYEHVARLCRHSAVERVTWFLSALAKRSANGKILDLPMSRVDISDYLGLAQETVSRAFMQLKKRNAIIEINLNRIEIVNLGVRAA